MSSDSTPAHHPALEQETDPDTRLVKRSAHASGSKYHRNADGDPACGVTTANERTEYVPWPPEQARAWREPCLVCYPPESEEHDEHDYMETED